ncbi:eukaryotic translation initiation factor 2 subunit 2 isoform X1 [Cryptotermes secundus]|uniref:eukaryotic translation initiation factor 2 subunit 2 isoform X1 n=1 Tax=Cryptotermes secundus TaxID=105785 RepID=UPI000CD7D8F0|nr:eukaryotic translation initiation factor 2 subunit 2 isoform X1 [Cryptotermes secundus]
MAEEDSIFDPTLKKKKKKKKTTFDIDAALAEGTVPDSCENADNMTTDKENQEPPRGDNESKDLELEDGNLDLENFGKKKKKKKKPFNMEELDGAIPESGNKSKEEGNIEIDGTQDEGLVEDSFDLDMDFSKTKKKKKTKKKDLDEVIAEDEKKKAENKENGPTEIVRKPEPVEDSQTAWFGQDRDYTYDELLTRVFDIMRDKNPDMVAGKKQKFVMRPPQVVRIGTKKTSFANFTEICKTLHRQPKHLLDFLLAELGTSGSVDGNNQLIIKGRFQQKQIENVLRRYIKEYVTCHTCRSPDTILQKDTRLFFLQCETCGSRCSVASIKSGFQAVTGKRAAIRAKTA